MDIIINDIKHVIPSDLSQIPLGKFVQWYQQYGKALDLELMAIFDKGLDSFEQSLDIDTHVDKEALAWYSFFTGFDFFNSTDIDLTDMLIQYRVLRSLLKDSESEARQFPMVFDWNNEQWVIQDFKVVPGSNMSFNEVITAKEVVRQIDKIGQGKWEALVYLCCIYLRKPNEPYKDEFLTSRFSLMETLPMSIAMSVAFFLSSSISIFKKHLLSSMVQALETKQQLS